MRGFIGVIVHRRKLRMVFEFVVIRNCDWTCCSRYQLSPPMYLLLDMFRINSQVNAITIGTVLDRYGPRVTAIMGSTFFALGSLLFGLGSECNSQIHPSWWQPSTLIFQATSLWALADLSSSSVLCSCPTLSPGTAAKFCLFWPARSTHPHLYSYYTDWHTNTAGKSLLTPFS